jgi:uncharacterized protein YdeI (YjbR/CyaY-like superfamily)
MNEKVSSGTVHKIPLAFKRVISSSKKALKEWEDITPLARNEFICWIEDAKKDETRIHRIEKAHNDLIQGKRRPCCWAGCKHR